MNQSTNSQTGVNNYSLNAPKILRKVKNEAYMGYSFWQMGIFFAWVFVTLILATAYIFAGGFIQTFILALGLAWWIAYAKYFAGEKYKESILYLKFLFDEFSGLHSVTRYDTKLIFLHDVFPLKKIHEKGLIEYYGNKYGVLMRYFPDRVNEQDILLMGARMQSVIDGLYGENAVKFIASSKSNMRKPLLDRLMSVMAKEKNKKVYDYLKSLYDMIEAKDSNQLEWSFILFFSLGTFQNLQDAKDALEAQLPGFQQNMKDAGVPTLKIENRNEVAKEYRQMCLPVVI